MNHDDLNELAGQIEALGRMILHLTARLEDTGLLDGPSYTDGLRHSIVLREDATAMMAVAQQTLIRVTGTMDEARQWRKFRRQAVEQARSRARNRPRAA